MLDSAKLNNGPTPAVAAEDLRRVWHLMHSRPDNPGVGLDVRLFAAQCLTAAAATVPLPQGVAGFNPDDLLAELNRLSNS